jgi:predicted O-methyltransferase YrrM
MPIHPIVQSMQETGEAIGLDGIARRYHSGISAAACKNLYHLAASLPSNPEILEIGMAHGTSSLQLLYGSHNQNGRLTIIDPGEISSYDGAGLVNIKSADYGNRVIFMEEPSYTALPKLVQTGQTFDLCFIDGHHTFDFTFVDYFYCDLLLKEGGILIFHDAQMWSVSKVIRFLRTHKDYRHLVEFNVACTPVQRFKRLVLWLTKPFALIWNIFRQPRRSEGVSLAGKGTLRMPRPSFLVFEPPSFPQEMQAYVKIKSRAVFWNEYHDF